MLIEGASLATEEPAYGFAERGFEHARAFQNRVAEWVYDGDEPVAVLRAPTGAGKTATFHELIDQNAMTLLVYPTNALLNQQAKRFEEEGTNVKVLTGDTLEGHHHERTENLLRTVNRWSSDHDVVLTNPDILQAVVQDMYAGGKAMEIFDRFDAIVYDEFHFYGDFAASGLLLQTRVIVDRSPNASVLLASATPNEDFVEFVQNVFDIPVRMIEATYDSNGDAFRHDVTLRRHQSDRILEDRDEVAELLSEAVDDVEHGTTRAVVVFNSVKDSNEFHSYLASEHPTLYERAEKDNGFDTNDPEIDLEDAEFSILNTTSKGEVGLDYDIRTLVMEVPHGPTAGSDFLQRFGRAGRSHQATVDVYGLGRVSWNDQLSFEQFVEEVYTTLGESSGELDKLADLVGMRAAHALHARSDYFNPELREDFASVDRYDRWRGFVESVADALDSVGGLGAPLQENDPETKLLQFTMHCFNSFESLRGSSLSGDVKYPRGDRVALTSYDLLTTLRYYDIKGIEDGDVIVLEEVRGDYPMQTTARLPGYESQPRNFSTSVQNIEETLQQWIHGEIDRTDVEESVGVNPDLLHLFFRRIRITDAAIPVTVVCGEYEIDVETVGIPTIDAHPREL